MENERKKGFSYAYVIVALMFLAVGSACMFLAVKAYPEFFKVKETRVQKDVTVTDEGIADSVEKIYDAVVVVSTYKNDKLYGTGTGFVYKVEGRNAYILTNNHVVESGTKVTVTFTDGKIMETKIVGTNALSDIAVLSVDKNAILQVAEIGNSAKLRVGDTAFAVGAPIDSVYSWTVTRGIISGKDRMVEVSLPSQYGDYIMKVLQTDAAINNGNSGGPLCNSNGEVIGITSLKLSNNSQSSASATIEGMGFAIPIETATEIGDKIIKGIEITQPYLGVQMLNVTDGYYYPEYYSELSKYNITKGVIAISIEDGSPADIGGLQEDDIIIKINNDETPSIAYLRYYLYNYSVGDSVNIVVLRHGEEKNLNIILGENQV